MSNNLKSEYVLFYEFKTGIMTTNIKSNNKTANCEEKEKQTCAKVFLNNPLLTPIQKQ